MHTCVLLQETSASPSLQEYCESAFFNIRHNPDFLIEWSKGTGVIYLSSENLLKIVEDAELGACAWILFRAIKIWTERGVHEEGFSSEERVKFAKQCCAKLELRMISTSDLLGPVTESGLIDQSAIIKAIQKQMSGSAIGLYGSDSHYVNGIFEKVLVNDSFEPLVGGDEEAEEKIEKRFDKKAQLDGTDTTLSILLLHHTNEVLLALLAPPKGASRLVIAGCISNILQDNRVLYKARVYKDGSEIIRNGAAKIKWKCRKETLNSKPPTAILGPGLSSKMPIAF